jgi:hypothetical protein
MPAAGVHALKIFCLGRYYMQYSNHTREFKGGRPASARESEIVSYLNIKIFLLVTPRRLVSGYGCFEGTTILRSVREIFTNRRGVTCKKTWIFSIAAVRSSNLVSSYLYIAVLLRITKGLCFSCRLVCGKLQNVSPSGERLCRRPWAGPDCCS